MANDKVNMPSSGAGITTFYEESKSKVLIAPHTIIGISVAIVIITILLNVM